jgi:transcriptional regulator with XRE-family HTH domain
MMEPELKPEFVKKIKKARKEKGIKVKSFADRYGLS